MSPEARLESILQRSGTVQLTRTHDPDQHGALLPVVCERCGRSGTYFVAASYHGGSHTEAAETVCLACSREIGLGQPMTRWAARRLRLWRALRGFIRSM